MIAGAALFFYSLVTFGDQVILLLGSTLIVFVGLGIYISARRSAAGSSMTGAEPAQRQPARPVGGMLHGPALRRRIPPGLREEVRRQAAVQPSVSHSEEAGQEEPPAERIPVSQGETAREGQGALLDQVIALLDEQGAQVEIETQREDAGSSRGILRVHSADGLPYTLLVLEGEEPVDVAELRALAALVTSNGSAGGYLVSSAPFTQSAYDWAGPRHLHRVREDELGEFDI